MRQFKQAQGMSINVIIIAIIVLIVLIVVVLLFSGYIKGWSTQVSSCPSEGGTCVAGNVGYICTNEAKTMTSNPFAAKCDTGYICCPPSLTKTKAPI
jgi:hypothetical protein